MEQLVTLIQTFGIPTALCMYVLYEKFQSDKRHEKRYDLIVDLVGDLKITVEKLSTLVDERLAK